jgi:hypothetical protein
VEGYLYRARGHRALEQSVFAAGERAGFSERTLRRAGRAVGITVTAGCWELPPARCQALELRVALALAPTLHRHSSVGVMDARPSAHSRRITRTPVHSRRLA